MFAALVFDNSVTQLRNRLGHLVGMTLRRRTASEVIILYEDFATGCAAKMLFEHVLRPVNGTGKHRLNMWKFNLLRGPTLMSQAAKDVETAALVCIAAHDWDFPPELMNWVKTWFSQPRRGVIALVVLLEGGGAVTSDTPTLAFLRRGTEELGIELLVCRAVPGGEPGGIIDITRELFAQIDTAGELQPKMEANGESSLAVRARGKRTENVTISHQN